MYIIWSDECMIILDDYLGPRYVTQAPDKKYTLECSQPMFLKSKTCIMVWGCIAYNAKGPLIFLDLPGGRGGGLTGSQYIEQVLGGLFLAYYRP